MVPVVITCNGAFMFITCLYVFPHNSPYALTTKLSNKSDSFSGWEKPYKTSGGAYNDQLWFIWFILLGKFKTNFRKYYFSKRIVDAWNIPPAEVVSLSIESVFKYARDKQIYTQTNKEKKKKYVLCFYVFQKGKNTVAVTA